MKGHGQSHSNITRRIAERQEQKAASRRATHSQGLTALIAAADLVIEDGRVVKNRYGAIDPPMAVERKDSMATLFRIHTEDKPGFVPLVSRYFTGATLSPVTGIWKGNVEGAMVIELVQPYYERQNVMRLANDILKANKQDAVMVTIQNSRGFDAVMVSA